MVHTILRQFQNVAWRGRSRILCTLTLSSSPKRGRSIIFSQIYPNLYHSHTNHSVNAAGEGFEEIDLKFRSTNKHLSHLKMKHLCEKAASDINKMQGNSSENITVAVEGNIGSGKSTLLRHFEKLPYCEVIGEPLNLWTDLDGHNALGLLYEDSERWSFSFNMYAQLTRIDMHMKPHTRPVKMLERSLWSTRYCFVQNDFLGKTINGFEFSVFSQWFDYLVDSGRANVDLIVYLRADPTVCYERLKKRSRKEEAGVPKCFIESLHNLHDEWLLEKKYPVPAPVLVLDANHDLDKMVELYDSRQNEILCGYNV